MSTNAATESIPDRHLGTISQWALGLAAIVSVCATIAVGAASTMWIGETFPGFFVLPNRVIPSVGLLGWSATRDGTIFQRTLIAVEGEPIASNAEAYQAVARRPVGQSLRYSLRHGSTTDTVSLPSRTFTRSDYWSIFGAYLANGLLYLSVGLLGAWLFPGQWLSSALLALGACAGAYALSAANLYDPQASMRIHALAEALFPAAIVHLLLVFPRDRGAMTVPGVALAWALSLGLAIPYQLLLNEPGSYSTLHGACETYLGLAGLALVASLTLEYGKNPRTAGPLLGAALPGALLGIGAPAVTMTLPGLSGGGLPVNVCAATAFLFPLSLGVGLIRSALAARRGELVSVAIGSATR